MTARIATASLTAVLALGLLPASALAHAVLERTTPERGAALDAPPERIELHFNEPVEAALGSLRIYDSAGEELDTGSLVRPGGRADALAVDLPDSLADGTYTATYRVISADSHPVAGGFVFIVGAGGGDAPARTVSELLDRSDASAAVDVALGAARWVSYLAIALTFGSLVFAAAVFSPALRALAGGGRGSAAAADGFAGALRRLLAIGIILGVAAGLCGLALQGAAASGASILDSARPAAVADVLETRFGTVWGLRIVAFAVLAAALAALPLRPAIASLDRVQPAATELASVSVPGLARRAAVALPAAFLVASPALAGHATVQEPSALLGPADVLHVLAVAVWVGGVACLVGPLRAATARLAERDRTHLLAETMVRFSPLALAAVVALVATGTLQSLIYLDALSDLWTTAFGRALMAKLALLALLVTLGAIHRRRSIPRLRAASAAGASPGAAGLLARRVLLGELAGFALALAAAALLAGQVPPSTLAAGPQSRSFELGDRARVELSVDPAEVGPNELHIYLFDQRSGTPYDVLRRPRLAAELPAEDIGPLELDLVRSGPGHLTAPGAALGITGEWRLELSGRVSRFESLRGSAEVEIR